MRTLALIASIAGMAAAANVAHAQDAEPQPVSSQSEVEAAAGPSDYFTGRAFIRRLSSAEAPGQAGTALVTFEPSARSNWHTHPAGQTLFVTEGCGLTQVEGGPVQKICAGDVVYARPGVKHWHGANSTERMSHLAITETYQDSGVDWLGPVTDAEYPSSAE